MKTKIRRAKVSDIRRLIEKVHEFYDVLKSKGARDIAQNPEVLRGGIVIEIGNGFSNPDWFCVVAERGDELIAVMVGMLEFCSPISEYFKCVKITTSYLEDDTLVGPKVLMGMWSLIEDWAKDNGAEFFYANIHPGNQPSVRAAKKMGFKHHYTQFFRPVDIEAAEEA